MDGHLHPLGYREGQLPLWFYDEDFDRVARSRAGLAGGASPFCGDFAAQVATHVAVIDALVEGRSA
jgi:hypothetical protein